MKLHVETQTLKALRNNNVASFAVCQVTWHYRQRANKHFVWKHKLLWKNHGKYKILMQSVTCMIKHMNMRLIDASLIIAEAKVLVW